jgi:hypothetical protein
MKHLNVCYLILAAGLFAVSNIASAEVYDFGRTKTTSPSHNKQEKSFKKVDFKDSFSKKIDKDSDSDRKHRKENSTVTSPVPEPETYAMILAGLGLIGFSVRRRNRGEE